METLIGQTKAKRADLGRAKGRVTSVNSSTRMEAVKLASETVTVTAKPSSPEAEEEASPGVAAAAAAAETDAEAAVAAELRCSSVAGIEVPRVRIPRIASGSNRRRGLGSEGTACKPRWAIPPSRAPSGMAAEAITALLGVRSCCGGGGG